MQSRDYKKLMEDLGMVANNYQTQASKQLSKLDQMSNEEINSMLDTDPALKEFMSIEDQNPKDYIVFGDNSKGTENFRYNYSKEPQNEISTDEPWFGILAADKPKQQSNQAYQQYAPQRPYYSCYQDERVTYANQHPGIRYYNINIYAFPSVEHLKMYYENLEMQREGQLNIQATLYGVGLNSSNAEEKEIFDQMFAFKPADEIVREYDKEQQKLYQQQQEAYMRANGIKNYSYDSRGARKQRKMHIRLFTEDNECVWDNANFLEKDKDGHLYETRTFSQDQIDAATKEREARMERNMQYAINAAFNQMDENNRRIEEEYAKCYAMGMDPAQAYYEVVIKNNNWRKEEIAIRELMHKEDYNKIRFDNMMNNTCGSNDFRYSNSSTFFKPSYDYARDLHYQELHNDIDKMDEDAVVSNRLKQEYDIKRNIFAYNVNNKTNSKHTEGIKSMGDDLNTIPKPNIGKLETQDYYKPENQVMYSQIFNDNPSIQKLDNVFIPSELTQKTDQHTIQENVAKREKEYGIDEDIVLDEFGKPILLDENGHLLPNPQQREIVYGHYDENGMPVDDDRTVIDYQNETIQHQALTDHPVDKSSFGSLSDIASMLSPDDDEKEGYL